MSGIAETPPKKRLCGKASQREHLDQLHLKAQEILEVACAQQATASSTAEAKGRQDEVEKRSLDAAQQRHIRAQEQLTSAQSCLEQARRALEAAQREAERVEQVALLAEKQAKEAHQQLAAELQSSELRRAAAEEQARQRQTQENVMIFKLKSLFSQLGLESPHGKQGVDCFIDSLQKFLADAGYPLRRVKPSPIPEALPEKIPEGEAMASASSSACSASALPAAPSVEGEGVPGDTCSASLSATPMATEEPKPVAYFLQASGPAVPEEKAESATNASNLILVMDGGGFRVQSSFPKETAEVRQQELRNEIKDAELRVDEKRQEKKRHSEAHLKLLADMEKQEEAAKPVLRELENDLAKAKESQEACAVEVTKVQHLQESFETLRENPEKAKPKAVKALKGPLQQLGLDEKQLNSLPETLAKKKAKRTPKERKFLVTVTEALQAQVKARRDLQSKCQKEVYAREEKLKAVAAEGPMRAKAIEASSKGILEKEAQIKTAEEQAETCIQALKDHEAKMTSVGKMLRFNSWSESCCICCDELPVDSAATLGCGHGWYCPGCINRFVEARLDEGISGDIPCPDCGKAISEEDLARLLPKQTIFRLHASNINRAAVASGAKPRPCPTPDCHMHKTFEEGKPACETCPLCEKESCWWCGAQPYHSGLTCEQHRKKATRSSGSKDDESFLQWMKDTGTKQCPTCGMATSKENLEMQTDQVEECHKMICRSCGTKFCFGCNAVLTESYTCGCTQNAHNFVDPHTGELVKHLQKKEKAKAKAKAKSKSRR